MVDQEISAFVRGLKTAKTMLVQNADHLLDVALGGTAVGTGVNTPKGYLDVMETVLPEVTGAPFRVKNNKFQGLALKDAFMMAHGALNTLATTLFKIANDVRFYRFWPSLRFTANGIYLKTNRAPPSCQARSTQLNVKP